MATSDTARPGVLPGADGPASLGAGAAVRASSVTARAGGSSARAESQPPGVSVAAVDPPQPVARPPPAVATVPASVAAGVATARAPQPARTQGPMLDPMPRRWEVWPGNVVFHMDGRLVTGRDQSMTRISIGLILVPSLLYLAVVVPGLYDAAAVLGMTSAVPTALLVSACVLCTLSFITLAVVNQTDPGIIARQPVDYDETSLSRPPLHKEVEIDGRKFSLKHCDTCNLYRPPRASHCHYCDNCVDGFDHHCPWVGNCIGANNYRFFYAFVSTVTAYCFYMICTSAHWVGLEARVLGADSLTAGIAVMFQPQRAWVGLGLIAFNTVVLLSIGGLWSLHTYLSCVNRTTHEEIRGSYRGADAPNPYDKGALRNCYTLHCAPRPTARLVKWRERVSDADLEMYRHEGVRKHGGRWFAHGRDRLARYRTANRAVSQRTGERVTSPGRGRRREVPPNSPRRSTRGSAAAAVTATPPPSAPATAPAPVVAVAAAGVPSPPAADAASRSTSASPSPSSSLPPSPSPLQLQQQQSGSSAVDASRGAAADSPPPSPSLPAATPPVTMHA